MKTVSIIVPVWNVEKYLARCLESLVKQTLDDIEILIINDGSPDNSQQIIDKYVSEYPTKIRAFLQKNSGCASARNLGIKYATAKYIGFVDSDDWVAENMFELLYNCAELNNSEVVTCGTYKVWGEDGAKFKEIIYYKQDISANKYVIACDTVWNKIYRRDFWLRYAFTYTGLSDDAKILPQIFYYAQHTSTVEKPLYYYYQLNDKSLFAATGSYSVEVMYSVFSELKSFYIKNKCTDTKLLNRIRAIERYEIYYRETRLLKLVKHIKQNRKFTYGHEDTAFIKGIRMRLLASSLPASFCAMLFILDNLRSKITKR